MRRMRRWRGAVALALGAATVGAWAQDASVPASRGDRHVLAPAWRRLDFEAHKLLLGASTSVTLHFDPLARAPLRAPTAGVPVKARGGEVAVLSVSSDLPFGRSERVTAWVDPSTGAALQTERLSSGRKPSWKVIRYLSDGLFAWRASPAGDQEGGLGPDRWSRRSERRDPFAAPPPAGSAVSDSYALLYLVSGHPFRASGDELRVVVPAHDRLVEARFVAGEEIVDHFDFERVEGGRSTRVAGEERARVVRGLGRAVGSSAADADVDLGFLGMRGEITILLDREMVPVEIRGRVQGVGRVVAHLRRVEMAPRSGGGAE